MPILLIIANILFPMAVNIWYNLRNYGFMNPSIK